MELNIGEKLNEAFVEENAELRDKNSKLTVKCGKLHNQLMETEKSMQVLICDKNKQISEMQSHIDCLKAELEEVQQNQVDLPLEPIEVAAMLIKATVTRKANSLQKAFNKYCPDEYEADRYSDEDLRQIAEHLLVYCNNTEVE